MRYKFLNVNPLGEKELDCVARAITLALNKDYYEVIDELKTVAKLFNCEELCVCCYKFLLDNVYGLERIEEVQGMTIYDFCHIFRKGVFLVRIKGHLTCVIDSYCYDTWDCTQEIIDIVWQVK
jgi:hypothetical protein